MSKIAKLRKKRNLTQRELAVQLGVTETTIRNWENGREGIDMFQKVARVCSALGCTAQDLAEEVKL